MQRLQQTEVDSCRDGLVPIRRPEFPLQRLSGWRNHPGHSLQLSVSEICTAVK